MTYQWSLLHSSHFSEISNEWDSLNLNTFNSAILESRFVKPAIDIFGENDEVIAICTNENLVVAMGVFKKYRLGCWSTFQPSQAPIGLWLCRADVDIERALRSLAKTLPGLTLLISILQQDSNLLPKPVDNPNISILEYIKTARISLDTDFGTYLQGKSKNTKKALRKQRNKLIDRGLETRLEIVLESNEVEDAIEQYGRLESAGWKSATNTAISSDNTQGKFYTSVLEKYCGSANGIIFKYWIGDQVAAMDLCISNQESIVILKTTYDENLGEYSPALLLHNELFKYIFENCDYRTIEFYGKVMSWHKKWSDDFRGIYHLNFYKNKFLMRIHNLN